MAFCTHKCPLIRYSFISCVMPCLCGELKETKACCVLEGCSQRAGGGELILSTMPAMHQAHSYSSVVSPSSYQPLISGCPSALFRGFECNEPHLELVTT